MKNFLIVLAVLGAFSLNAEARFPWGSPNPFKHKNPPNEHTREYDAKEHQSNKTAQQRATARAVAKWKRNHTSLTEIIPQRRFYKASKKVGVPKTLPGVRRGAGNTTRQGVGINMNARVVPSPELQRVRQGIVHVEEWNYVGPGGGKGFTPKHGN